ncbi:MAG: hypothetical protein WD512_19365 [Candidatus Paceibacterota bacterium]
MVKISFTFSMIYVYIAIAVVIAYFVFRDREENLRIQGSLDLRGDPDTAPSYADHMGMIGSFPFNFGTSFPTERRRMVME